MVNCRFIGNEGSYGGGIYAGYQSLLEISGCEFSGNYGQGRGGAVYCGYNSQVSIINCTISDNRAPRGGGIAIEEGDLTLQNTIISFSTQGEAMATYSSPDIYICYSNIFGNAGGNWTSYISEYYGTLGNISLDPIYSDTYEGDYHLAADSPCINAGDPQSPEDPDGTCADMGAYYYNLLTGVDDHNELPNTFVLNQNYPNPFNASTMISFDISEPGFVRLTIYDLLGREVDVLLDDNLSPGMYHIKYNATDLSSGVYFYRLQKDNLVNTRRMLLLK